MGFLSFLFGEKAPETALGEPVAPETLPADGNYPNSMPIIYSYFMNPSPTEGGLKLARRYKNRCAVLGVVQKGAFQANDYVIVTVGGKPTKVQTGPKTVTRQKVKLDGNGQPIAKQAQQLEKILM